MNINAYKQSVIQAQKEAKAYLEGSDVKQYKGILSTAQWDDFFDRSGGSEARVAYDAAQKMIAEDIAKPIAQTLRKGGVTEGDFYNMLNEAEEKFHYRFLEVMGKKPEEISSDWIGKSLSRSRVYDAIKDEHTGSTLVERSRSAGFYWDFEARLAERIFEIPIGEIVISFYGLEKDEGYKLKEFYRNFAEKGEPEEFLGVMLDYAKRADGLRPTYPHEQIFNHVLAEVASVVYKDNNIGIGDIARLRERGIVKATGLWDTKYFNENFAPVNTDEHVDYVKGYMDKYSSNKEFYEVVPNLSKQEILSYFLRSGSLNNIDIWKFGMAAFEVVTGERLSFQEARDLKPVSHFSLASTQAYSDRLDEKVDPAYYRQIHVTIERAESEDYKYDDGHKAVQISLDCKSVSLDSIENAMLDEMLKYKGINFCNATQEGIWYEFATDADDHMGIADSIAKKLEQKLEELNKVAILPGDVVKVNHEEAAEYDLSNGKVAVVTDVNFDGSIKLKGDKTYYPSELFDLRKKHQLSKEAGVSLDM